MRQTYGNISLAKQPAGVRLLRQEVHSIIVPIKHFEQLSFFGNTFLKFDDPQNLPVCLRGVFFH
jgi:hypothetical protein